MGGGFYNFAEQACKYSQIYNNNIMKLKNFFFAALAATFAFASCEQADPNGDKNDEPTAEFAGNWWLSVKVGDVEKVAGFNESSYGYINLVDAVVGEDGSIASYAENVYTFTAVVGGYTIKDSAGKYLYMGLNDDGTWYNSFQLSTELPAENGVWSIETLEDGTVKIVNVDQKYILQCSTGQYTSFGVYDGVQDAYLLPKLVKADNPVAKPTMVWTPGTKFYNEKVKLNGSTEETPAVKLGSSSAVGSGSIIIPAGTVKLSFYGVAWKGKQGQVNVTGNGVEQSFTFAANDGASNSSPYTISVSETDKYQLEFTPALAADTELKFETVSGKTRVIMWGFVAE